MIKTNFTKRKFLAFPIERQHKKCAELLRITYEKCISKNSTSNELELYAKMAEWMKSPQLEKSDLQCIADRFHSHAQSASLKFKEHHLLPQVRKGDRNESKKNWNIAVYLDQIRSAHNVGSILRTVEAFALGSVYFSETTPTCSHKQVKDTAMGAEKWVQCFESVKLQDLPRPIIALETSDSAISLFDYLFPETFTLVVGNEEYGCSESSLQAADVILEIPLRGRKNSLNVANAFAIASGEISRQRISMQSLKGENCCE